MFLHICLPLVLLNLIFLCLIFKKLSFWRVIPALIALADLGCCITLLVLRFELYAPSAKTRASSEETKKLLDEEEIF
jgi:hypothetical protein